MKNRISIYISIAFGLILIAIWLHIVDLTEIVKIINKIELIFIIPLVLTFILIYFLRSLRWRIILLPVVRISVLESFNLCMANYFINFLIPVHAGEIAKSLFLKKIKGTPVSESILTVYIDKITDFLPIFILLTIAPFLQEKLSSVIYLVSGISLIVMLIFCGMLISIVYKKEAVLVLIERIFIFLPNKFMRKIKDFLNTFSEALLSMASLSNNLLGIFALTILSLIVHCFFMWLFFYSFGINLPPLTVLVGYLLLNASFILPAPPGFSGSLELIFIFIFTYIYGYDSNLVGAVAASSHVFIAILFGLLGLWSMTLIGTKLSTVLKIQSENRSVLEKI